MMDNNQYIAPPPPVPPMAQSPLPPYFPPQPKPMSYGLKAFLMGLIACLLMIGTLTMWIITRNRSYSDNNVSKAIISQWGSEIEIAGPFVSNTLTDTYEIAPLLLNCDANIQSLSLHRGIYDVEVYNANIAVSGKFLRSELERFGDSAVIKFTLPTKQLTNFKEIDFGGQRIELESGHGYLYATVPLANMPDEIPYSVNFEMRGSEAFYVQEIGHEADINVHGNAENPSFSSDAMPEERSITSRGFAAQWRNSGLPDWATVQQPRRVGSSFLTGVTNYQKVERSLKYSFMIILLTFISVLFIEMIRKETIPLFNYFLIGVALILFYTLLLSFSELIAFAWAYLIAAGMTVALITGYMWRMLRSRKLGLSIGSLLTLMYLFCYMMLTTSTYALLLGSLILFFALAAIMYASLKVKRI